MYVIFYYNMIQSIFYPFLIFIKEHISLTDVFREVLNKNTLLNNIKYYKIKFVLLIFLCFNFNIFYYR